MFRKLRSRARARLTGKSSSPTSVGIGNHHSSDEPVHVVPQPILTHTQSTPATAHPSRTPSDSSPLITRAPSLPHSTGPSPSPSNLHSIQSSTEIVPPPPSQSQHSESSTSTTSSSSTPSPPPPPQMLSSSANDPIYDHSSLFPLNPSHPSQSRSEPINTNTSANNNNITDRNIDATATNNGTSASKLSTYPKSRMATAPSPSPAQSSPPSPPSGTIEPMAATSFAGSGPVSSGGTSTSVVPINHLTASSPNSVVPSTHIDAMDDSASNAVPAAAAGLGSAAADRYRRLSLDGDLPPGAIRPDDRTSHDDDDSAVVDSRSEGVLNVQPDVFLPDVVDVSACSCAGWEPMRGNLPDVPPTHTVEVRKENQDAYCALAPFLPADPVINTSHSLSPFRSHSSTRQLQIFLGVFDGHGAEGRPIAHYARDYITGVTRDAANALMSEPSSGNSNSPKSPLPSTNPSLHRARLNTLRAAFSRAERALTEVDSGIDHVFSGTTAVVTWLFGRELYTAWTGDSRGVIGRVLPPENGRIRFRAVELSHDQKPSRNDEKRRVRAAGGRIARWQRNVGPLRVWLPRDWTPGLAMTRSIGDTVLSEYGVCPVPEVSYTTVGATDSFVVLASDGVWEFMSSQEVVDLVGRLRREGRSAADASDALVREAVRRWRRHEVVVDDTTAVVMYMRWEDDDDDDATTLDPAKKGADMLLSKSRKILSKTRAKVSSKAHSHGVYLVANDGQLVNFHCKNDNVQSF